MRTPIVKVLLRSLLRTRRQGGFAAIRRLCAPVRRVAAFGLNDHGRLAELEHVSRRCLR
jgi:hypothetical protein